jgi:hypothetical protein
MPVESDRIGSILHHRLYSLVRAGDYLARVDFKTTVHFETQEPRDHNFSRHVAPSQRRRLEREGILTFMRPTLTVERHVTLRLGVAGPRLIIETNHPRSRNKNTDARPRDQR